MYDLLRSLRKTFVYGQINSVDAGLGRGVDCCRAGELQSHTVTSQRPGSHSYSGVVIWGEMKWAWRYARTPYSVCINDTVELYLWSESKWLTGSDHLHINGGLIRNWKRISHWKCVLLTHLLQAESWLNHSDKFHMPFFENNSRLLLVLKAIECHRELSNHVFVNLRRNSVTRHERKPRLFPGKRIRRTLYQ